jgi:opacity protein-like surface antigen
MSKSVKVMAAALLFAAAAAATEVPRYEVYAGYDFVRFNPNSGFIPSFNANGGSGQFIYNFNKWIGAVFDAGAVTKGVLGGFSVDTTVANFVAGPRVQWHSERWIPFGEVLFGGAYATTSTQIFLLPAVVPAALAPGLVILPGLPVSARLGASNTDFAMLAGGGLDIKLSKHISFRPVEADYYLTRMPSFLTNNNTTNRNNFRYSGGITFMFGGAK